MAEEASPGSFDLRSSRPAGTRAALRTTGVGRHVSKVEMLFNGYIHHFLRSSFLRSTARSAADPLKINTSPSVLLTR